MKNQADFGDAVTRLNSRNLNSLLRLCSYLSSLELFSATNSPVFPLWNFEKQRLLVEAVLASRAAPYKTGSLTNDDLRFVINAAGEALYDPRIKEELRSGEDRPTLLFKTQRYFARMANVQLRHQEYQYFMEAGRLMAMFEILPTTKTDYFPSSYRERARRFPELVRNTLGTSIFELFLIHCQIWRRYAALNNLVSKYAEQNPLPSSSRIETVSEEQARAFFHIVGFFSKLETTTQFKREELRGICPGPIRETTIEIFLMLFSRTIRELRSQATESAYQFGPTGWQLSPLERYPVVKTEGDPASYCVPNVRTFIRSFPDVIHFSLQDALDQEYNDFRGIAQEVYIRTLGEERLSVRCLLPERRYKKPLGEDGGPDLTVVEEPLPRLIVLEAKGKRLLAETRFTLTEDAFDRNYRPVYEALDRLKDKVLDLYAELDEYRDVQGDLNATKGHDPIAVVVVGESTFCMTELIRYRAVTEPDHPLASYPFRFCVMSPQTFELAVEHSANEGRPLYELLDEFWQDSCDLEPSRHMAENYRGRQINEWQTVACGYLKCVLREHGIEWFAGDPGRAKVE